MARLRRRDAWAVAMIVIVAALCAASPLLDPLHGLSIDLLTAWRWHAFGQRHAAAESPAVVVAIDEPTYRTPPFEGSPTIVWTREIGRVLGAVIDGGAAAVGFDIVFPSSIEQSALPFGDAPLGERLRGFDRDYLRALRAAAQSGRFVLGEVQHREQPIRPAAGQRVAVGGPANLRLLNVASDPDEVVRRVPLAFASEQGPVPSMAVELAARARRAPPAYAADGNLTLAGWRVPSAEAGTLTLNFDGGADDIPTYSLADLRACVERGDAGFFKRQFAGKVVIFGTLLDIEDRRMTSKRFATGIEHAGAPRCALPPVRNEAQPAKRTIAGVYIHATAVGNLLRHDVVIEPGRAVRALLAGALALGAAAAALRFAPPGAIAATLGLAIVYTVAAVSAFRAALALPLVEPIVAGGAALAATVGWRFVVADREERLLRRGFALYLSPQVIDRMLESGSPPALGGEMRRVTLLFSDIAGFSTIAEGLTPAALVSLMNDYLSAMTEIIEDAGGYVDKYIGDSIVAVFGAPLDDPDHAAHAVRAALRCRDRLAAMNGPGGPFEGRALAHRIGLNTGEALVGNIGSRRRFNYTVMSDAVNLASRLEGANKYFGTSILASADTMTAAGTGFAWREIDAIRVKGRAQPVAVFEPLAEVGSLDEAQTAIRSRYAEGLEAWRAREFARASERFEAIAEHDPPARQFLQRAQQFAAAPPGSDWEPVYTLEGK